ncbi:histone deacetylase interacting [Seiridium cupressi]
MNSHPADEMAHRERDSAERHPRDPRDPPYPAPTGTPHHSNAASLPIHQPVASRLPGAIHSPGGLLASHGSAPPIPLGGPPNASFPGGPLADVSNRPQPQNAQNASSQMFSAIVGGGPTPAPATSAAGSALALGPPLQQENTRPSTQAIPFGGGSSGGGAGGPPIPPGAGALQQGQQPILNDALSYLDQVKVQFAEQPDVYNRFLDIMKDFKSQTIDTPGVIKRVSELFAGHPNLIQGFNTFLPPGYRIECGEGNPSHIRVTTPMGTTLQPITAGKFNFAENNPSQPASGTNFFTSRTSNWQQQQSQPQTSIESPEAQFSTPAVSAAGLFAQAQGPSPAGVFDGAASSQPQRGGSQVPNSTTPNAPGNRNALTPTPGAQNSASGGAAQAANMEKRGPVEFNHAISYVNKIKVRNNPYSKTGPYQGGQAFLSPLLSVVDTRPLVYGLAAADRMTIRSKSARSQLANHVQNRFQDKPEIYKQFLEILQTYQREQKPIQDVYAQVTSLFNTAPDLLEDFKQFLPESAASTNKSGLTRSEEPLGLSALAQSTPQPSHTIRDGQKMPPVGNFAPPSATKENKKRPRNDKAPPAAAAAPSISESLGPAGQRIIPGISSSTNKRPKLGHKPLAADAPLVEPTLTPVMPEPLPPASDSQVSSEELGFFEKVKKHISNRATMVEFLKLCNMYSQNLIDKDDVIHKASQFIGGNPELLKWFKEFMGYEGYDENIENRPQPPMEKVSLSNCRSVGPSYRLLPRKEKLKPCSGRDEMCNAVLNDEWASHPTWASEDSGFVAHRKNAFEEGLHRIEEERHDYDFNIEANHKCIQLLEPIAQQMLNMLPHDREQYSLPQALNGTSTSIYKRVLKKIYGAEKGVEVVNDMFENPFAVVPVVLARLKQKDEEWRFTQREWEKVWQAQTEIMHLKSLDHMGIQVKQSDKRNLSVKHLVDSIKTKHEEQRRLRSVKAKVPRYQYSYELGDQEVLYDLLRFMVLYGTNNGHHSASEKERIIEFFESFIPQFFDLPEDKVAERLHDIDRDSVEDDAEEQLPTELTNGRSRRNGKRSDLLRGVLDPGRNGTKGRKEKEGSAASGSKESTPDNGSGNEEEMADVHEDAVPTEMLNERWLPIVPRATVVKGNRDLLDSEGELKADGFFPRRYYHFFCNQTIYVFLTIFVKLYQRLKAAKESQGSVLEEIARSKSKKPAKQLGIAVNEINYFDEEDPASFWPKTVELIEDYITGEIDDNRYQEVFRHYYLKKGWTLYTIQDLLKTLCRLSLVCTSTDAKEKTPDLISHFLHSRGEKETSFQTEMTARTFAQKCVKDGDLFLIQWFPTKAEATIRWLQRDETTFHMDELELKERWQYYISSFMRVEPTEGVPRQKLRKPVLARNLPSSDVDSDDGNLPKPVQFDENLILKICLNTNKMGFEKGTSEYFIYNTVPATAEEKAAADERRALLHEWRSQHLKERFVMNNGWLSNGWMKNLPQDEVQKANENFQKWVKEGAAPTPSVRDEVMGDAE